MLEQLGVFGFALKDVNKGECLKIVQKSLGFTFENTQIGS